MDDQNEFRQYGKRADEVYEEKAKEEAYNKEAAENITTDNPDNQSKNLFSRYGKYKGTLKENNKDAYRFSKTISICVLIGTVVGIIIGIATGAVAYALLCIFPSFFIGLIINAIINKGKKNN